MAIRRQRRAFAGVARVLAVSTLTASMLVAVSAQSGAAAAPDGQTQFTAAASCWEIKQNTPSAQDGVYWLITPTLKAPEQFYCDMTTDGGGWVLIGRGREGWRNTYEGLGTTAQVRSVVNGPNAFQVRQLSSRVIDGLLDGGRVDQVPDGIRLRRAMNTGGTQWQEARFNFANRDRWVWTFPAEHRVGSFRFGTSTGSGGQTSSFGTNNQYNRVITTKTAAQGWTAGWAYGNQVSGTTSSTSYLWSNSIGTGQARPFTQMFLRPRLKLDDLDFPDVPDSGSPADELPGIIENGVLPTPWGVVGRANGSGSELATEVQDFAQIGDYVYVGGNFRWVQRNSSGAGRVEQSYLAAFHVDTGEWISGFRPTFNNQVNTLAVLPDGRLVAGGEFSQVNGQTARGMVALDPMTGATDPSWHVDMENRLTSGFLSVRSLSVKGDWLYAGGAFTHMSGGSVTSPIYARSGARFSVTDGSPDVNWNPNFDGTAVDVDASADGSRLYAAGYFGHSNGQPALRAAAVRTVSGAPLAEPAWTPTWSRPADRTNYQQAIREAGDRVWVGGAEHSVFSFSTATFERLSGNITKAGGDFQAMAVVDGVVYAGCHCDDWNYSNAFFWPGVGTDWTQADKIGWVSAWDQETGEIIPDFNPIMRTDRGHGAWGIFGDSNGTVWIGGDFTTAINQNGGNQWTGGFARFPARDTTAPAAPSSLSGQRIDNNTVRLTWGASSSSNAQYELMRDGQVIFVTSDTTIEVPSDLGDDDRFFVRAVDATGNRSASTSVLDLSDPLPPEPGVLIEAGSDWSWRYESAAVNANWAQPGFNASSWNVGPAILGWGSAAVETNIDVPSGTTRPLAAYFRHEFDVDDADEISSVELETWADDGVVVYMNGEEVGRWNMPDGTITGNTFATAAPRTNTARANPVTVTIPGDLLEDGANVVAAEVHLNYRSTPDASFDLTLTESESQISPPAAPTATAIAQGENEVLLEWDEPSDENVVAHRITRTGADDVDVDLPELSHLVEGLAPDTEYTWEVRAVDTFGRTSDPTVVSARTDEGEPPPPEPVVLVEKGSDWSWRYESTAVDADWAQPGFDASSWAEGPAVLGWGSASVETNIDVPSGTTRPLAAYFRHEFDVDDPDDLTEVELLTRADDGVVVYMNGEEVGRWNMPGGTITGNTYATAAPRTNTAVANAITVTVPTDLLVEGANVVAAEVHLNYRSTPDVSFDLGLVAEQ
ncbi:fibrinogen-like YCDxxxxGGGW domain-containing protein [Phytoactinopolyspora limicola]|uniref:fibrinogen-like YCDxxxxGGGW domain-containing protein n=1 Tax=Phytoactinopolyspora limicola TaxID=2715536 RepID=UPI00140E581F|nr:fibrinogen-like YCDxxxxGGGW domain-containing protein [Phytoactinopolyspora limicola]